MVPFSFGCGSAVLAAIAILAPSRAARTAIASPMPRLAPEMNSVLPLSDVMSASARLDCLAQFCCEAYRERVGKREVILAIIVRKPRNHGFAGRVRRAGRSP